MEQYAGIDVSLELSSVCVVDAQGKIVRETKVPTDPKALVSFFETLGRCHASPCGMKLGTGTRYSG
jgi:transposase